VTNRPEIKPTVDFSLSEAAQELTGFETIALEKKFGKRMDAFGVGEAAAGFVWTFENRDRKVSFDEIAKWTNRELSGYFAPEPEDELDDDDDSPKG
jgi:hypothetical protein